MVTDAANTALSFSLFYQQPSIIHLPAFSNIELGGDKLYSLFSFTTSFKELQTEITQILENPTPPPKKRKNCQLFTRGFIMNAKEQIKTFINIATKDIKSHLSTTTKNILFISFYPTYRSQYGDLIQQLSKHYNVITIVDRILNDDFEKSGNHNALFPWRIIENSEVFYLNTHIEGIDIIITADQIAYQDGKIDREFLSKSAKRIYLPHRLTYACGESSRSFDYIIVPSKSAMKSFKKAFKDSKIKLLPCGYPQLDKAIKEYQYQPANTITYSPTLRDIDPTRNANQNLYAGFDSNIIEWITPKYLL